MTKDDLISRQAAIDALGGNEPVGDPSKMDDDDVVKMWERIRIINIINKLPPAQPETHEERTETHACDLISRQAAIDAVYYAHGTGMALKAIKQLPSAQPERLTDDDFETIRIHLNAYKEKLCNQHRWEEADEYQRIIDRFMAFASAQPDSKELSPTHKALDTISRQAAIDVCDYAIDLWHGQLGEGIVIAVKKKIEELLSAQPLVLTCDGCRHVGTYDTDFPCSGCIRREKDYYEQER